MSVDETSPESLFGGKWERLENRVLVGAGSSYSVNSTGGAETRNISHTHGSDTSRNGTLSAAIGSVNNNAAQLGFTLTNDIPTLHGAHVAYSVTGQGYEVGGTFNHWTQVWGTTASGGTTALDVRQPYLAVYMWKRIS